MSISYTKSTVQDLYKKIDANKIVLPNFQRDFVWDVKKQKSLITSFLIDLPIGSTLHLEGDKNDFSARLICKTPTVVPADDCEYVLDGQQRISTLKNAFYNFYNDRKTWLHVYEEVFSSLWNRWFVKIDLDNDVFNYQYLQFDQQSISALEPDEFTDLVINKRINKSKDYEKWFHPNYNPKDDTDKPLTLHRKILAQAKQASDEMLIPLYEISSFAGGLHRKVLEQLAKKRIEILKAGIADKEYSLFTILGHLEPEIETFEEEEVIDVWSKLQVRWSEAVASYLEKLLEKELPIILLPRNEISRAASIFEEINRGGTPLSIFDLIVAKAAKSMSSSLSEEIRTLIKLPLDVTHINNSITDWNASLVSDITSNTPTKTFQSIYLNVLSIVTFGMHGNEVIDKTLMSKEKILSVKSDDIKNYTDKVVLSISRAFAFLQLRCGLQKDSEISYEYMILPISYLLYNDSNWMDTDVLNKLEAWYWSSLFAGQYNTVRPDEQVKLDFELLLSWLDKDKKDISNIDKKFKNTNGDIDLHVYQTDILNKNDYSDLNTLTMKNQNIDKIPKAIQSTILQYILSLMPRDFSPNQSIRLSAYNATKNRDVFKAGTNYKQYKLERHHIIPLATATNISQSSTDIRGDDTCILNSPLNFADISESANREIGAMNIAQYMSELGNTILDHMLASSSFYTRLANETDQQFYDRCLKERYRILKDTVIREVDNLLH